MMGEKEQVRDYWNEAPCGTREFGEAEDERLFAEVERARDEREPFIPQYARFAGTKGQKVLEVGVGAGTDHLRFARAGAVCSGIDLTQAGIDMTSRRLARLGLHSDLRVGDAEHLPFADNAFDVVYSWGVIHHTPDTPRAAREILRVLKPGGRFCVMIYNRRSLLAAQAWVVYGLLKGEPLRPISQIIGANVESPGTKAYTAEEARRMFAGGRDVRVESVVTPYDMRVGRRRFLPRWTHRLVPPRLGWFHIITGTK